MNDFNFSYPTKVYFGKHAAKKAINSELNNIGKTVMIAYGGGSVKRNGIYDEIVNLLKEADKVIIDFGGIMPNPTYQKVQEGAKLARDKNVDFILAVGGGSVIDCCKVISVQATIDQDVWDLQYKEHIYPAAGIAMAAIVTASGTGAEMNSGAVITHEDKKWKGPIIGSSAIFAVLDPAYTMTLPMKQVISGAFDTLSHCMETYLGIPRDYNISDEINEAIMRNTIKNIRVLLNDPKNYEARSDLMWTSAMAENGILKVGKVTDFQAHQIEHQLGAYTDCNHGQGLAAIHPAIYRHMYKDAVKQFARLARVVWNVDDQGLSEAEVALAGIEALQDFIKEIGLPVRLSDMNITDINILKAVANTCNLSAGCAKKFERSEIFEILKESL